MEFYPDEPEYVQDDSDDEAGLVVLIYRCQFTHVAYCNVGGHFLVIYDDMIECPMGCNT